jgi:hypothetical protein
MHYLCGEILPNMITSTEERIALLEEFKTKDWFILDEWEDREQPWPGDDVVEQMKLEVLDFTNFLIIHLKKEGINLQAEAQKYFKDWDTEYFKNEEVEFIVEIEYEAMRHAGLNIEALYI